MSKRSDADLRDMMARGMIGPVEYCEPEKGMKALHKKM
jgi:hypothetical protein